MQLRSHASLVPVEIAQRLDPAVADVWQTVPGSWAGGSRGTIALEVGYGMAIVWLNIWDAMWVR